MLGYKLTLGEAIGMKGLKEESFDAVNVFLMLI
jgi:hypothetical protein